MVVTLIIHCHFSLLLQEPSSSNEQTQKMFLTITDLKEVYATTFEAHNEWRDILLALKLSKDTIDDISLRCHDNPEDCYCEGLKEWLEGGERSWGDLVEALASPTVGHHDIAMAIEKDYLQSSAGIVDSGDALKTLFY